jgi:hypothetical protein
VIADLEQGKNGKEPIARMLQDVKDKSHVNFKLLGRIVDF